MTTILGMIVFFGFLVGMLLFLVGYIEDNETMFIAGLAILIVTCAAMIFH